MSAAEEFRKLSHGLSFDRVRFHKDIALFERPCAGTEDASVPLTQVGEEGAAPSTSQVAGRHLPSRHAPFASLQQAARFFPRADLDDAAAAPLDEAEQGGDSSEDEAAREQRRQLLSSPEGRILALRRRFDLRVQGSAPPPPLFSFADVAAAREARGGAALARALCALTNVASEGWRDPTPIQRQAIPALLEGRDVMGIAPTGSGKTLAFLLPLAILLASKAGGVAGGEEEESGEEDGAEGSLVGPRALVLSPTRELMVQTAGVARFVLPGLGVKASMLSQAGSVLKGVSLLLATPRRLAQALQASELSLASVRYLVLDEADKLLAQGAAGAVDAALAACTHESLCKALFSATMPGPVETLARSILRDPLRLGVGAQGAAAQSVRQELLYVSDDRGRNLALRQLLASGQLAPPALVFAADRARVEALRAQLVRAGVQADAIHEAQPPAERAEAVRALRAGTTWVLVTTDLLARGVDFPTVQTVVNFDCPRSTAEYVHRVGRTGRGGRKGRAVTLFGDRDRQYIAGIAKVAAEAGAEVPDWMFGLRGKMTWNEKKRLGKIRKAGEDGRDDERKKKKKKKRETGLDKDEKTVEPDVDEDILLQSDDEAPPPKSSSAEKQRPLHPATPLSASRHALSPAERRTSGKEKRLAPEPATPAGPEAGRASTPKSHSSRKKTLRRSVRKVKRPDAFSPSAYDA